MVVPACVELSFCIITVLVETRCSWVSQVFLDVEKITDVHV